MFILRTVSPIVLLTISVAIYACKQHLKDENVRKKGQISVQNLTITRNVFMFQNKLRIHIRNKVNNEICSNNFIRVENNLHLISMSIFH